MISLIFSLMFMGANNIVGTLPKELEVPMRKEIKKSRGKGRGNTPYFAKFM